MKTLAQHANGKQSEEDSSLASENQGSSSASAGDKIPSSSLTRRATGPRTPLGKQRSKRNATKYALFSSLVLLEGEGELQSELNSPLERI